MKPCSKYRKPLALLAAKALDKTQESLLRAHVENCPACRSYLTELSIITQKLVSAEFDSDLEPSPRFHHEFVARLSGEEESIWFGQAVAARLRSLTWRLALPVVTVIVVLISAALLIRGHRAGNLPIVAIGSQPGQPAAPHIDLLPTVANYQMVAN